MFSKILIANRGEIACRVIRTCKRLGIRTVAVHSDADRDAQFVRDADEAWRLGPAPAADSYLRGDLILDIARRSGAQAIHPGYGFLSENAGFAAACAEAGVVFIGPPVEAIAAMGSKSAAKRLMEAAGVPLVPGYHGDAQDSATLHARADDIGYPVLIKASAGGGGKGMRIVGASGEFDDALASCRREAAASFGDDRVLIERYLQRPRHIEMQVFADSHGHCVHLFERDCSVQRRHQKVLEEAPAPGMSDERRREMGEAACNAARAVGYVGAGTVEFIVEPDGRFHFMEMNTRLQVEHPVTEMITGLDLVEWQLRVAAGEPLPCSQSALTLHGHAIEARVYAEDPERGFLPATGKLRRLSPPQAGTGVRIDSGVAEGDSITPFYDPMIAKLIVWAEDRDAALARLDRALADWRVVGVATNIDFLRRLITHPAFAGADLDTGLIERHHDALFPSTTPAADVALLAAALAECQPGSGQDAWKVRPDWRLNQPGQRTLRFVTADGREHAVHVRHDNDGARLTLDDIPHCGMLAGEGEQRVLHIDGHRVPVTLIRDGEQYIVYGPQGRQALRRVDPLAVIADDTQTESHLRAPMPGRVVAVLAEAGRPVEKGAPLMILEAMKMEHTITAPSSGSVSEFYFAAGEQVGEGADLLDFVAA